MGWGYVLPRFASAEELVLLYDALRHVTCTAWNKYKWTGDTGFCRPHLHQHSFGCLSEPDLEPTTTLMDGKAWLHQDGSNVDAKRALVDQVHR